MGDDKQLQPIEAGGAFNAIGKRVGQADLTEIKRQREVWAREAVKDIASGDGRAALRAFAERGLFHIAEGREGAMEKLVSQWKEFGVSKPKDCLIFAGVNTETRILNRLAQEERLKAGALGTTFLNVGQERVYEGDRVLFTQNSNIYGVKNGQIATVDRIDAGRNAF